MSNTDHTARPDSWARITEQAGWGDPYADLIVEFSARLERLEQAQQQPEPEPAAGQGELVRKVAQEICPNSLHDWTPMASRAILAVILWLESQAWRGAADALRREVGR